ncbi:PAS domain S-box protein, partial [Chloroflexota bacterium]
MAETKKGNKQSTSERELEVRNKIKAAFINASDGGIYPKESSNELRTKQLETDIRERMKEIQCLYTVSSITQNQTSSSDDVLQEIADSIPPGMQYPETAYARIVVYGKEYTAGNYSDTKWKISADIREKDTIVGNIEIGYLQIKPNSYYTPFFEEEIKLVSAVADLTGIYFERKHSQEMFENVATSSPISIYIVQDSKFQYVNPEFVKSSGYSEEELVSMDARELIFEEDKEEARNAAIEMLKGQRFTPYEYRVVNKDGNIRWVMESLNSIQYNGRRATIGSHIDITEIKQGEESLRESEAFNLSILENAPYQINVINPDTSIRYVNPSFEEANGWSLEEVIGLKAPYPWWPKGNEEEQLTRFKKAIERGRGKTEISVNKRDGNEYWLEMYWSPVKQDGELKYTLVNAVDVTERKHTDEELKLRAQLLDNAGDAITVNDIEGNLVYVNERFCESVGLKREQLIGKNLKQLDMPHSHLSTEDRFRTVTEKGEQTFETVHVKKDGTFNYVEVHSLLIESGGNKLIFNAGRDINERKQAEISLQQERDKAATYLDIVGVIIVAINDEGNITLINKKGCDVLGYTEEELIGKNWFEDFIPPRIKSKMSAVSEKFLSEITGSVKHYETPVVTKSGKERLLSWTDNIIKDENGNITGHLSSGQDITERRETEEALQESEAFQARLLDISPNPIFVINPDTSIRYVNPALEKLTGFTSDELIGLKTPHPWWREERHDEAQRIIRDSIEENRGGRETLFRKKSGEKLWVETISTPVKLDGKLQYILVTWNDVTERKETEEALQESETFRSSMMNSSPTPILVINPDTTIKYANPALEKLTGYSVDEIIGTGSPYPWWRKKATMEATEKLNNAMQQGSNSMEVLFQKKDGKKFWVEATSTPVRVDEKLQYTLLSWNDVTER